MLGHESPAGSLGLVACPPEVCALVFGVQKRGILFVFVGPAFSFFFFTGLLSAHLSTWQVYFVSGHLLDP